MSYRKAFENLLQELKSNPVIDVERAILNDSLGDFLIQINLGYTNLKLHENLQNFYLDNNGTEIIWRVDLDENITVKKFDNDDSIITGRIEIIEFQQMIYFDTELDSDSWKFYLDEREKNDLMNFRYFDYNDDNIRSGFVIEDNFLPDDMVFLEQDSTGFCPVPLTFKKYLNAMLKLRGFQGWQQALFYKKSDTKSFERMIFYLSQIFPEENFDTLL